MAMLSLWTDIAAPITINTIEDLLLSHGAMDIRKRYGKSQPRQIHGISFGLDTPAGPREYIIPVDVERTLRAIEHVKGAKASQRTPEHARRVAWRIALRWLEVTLALVDVGYTTTAAAVSSFEEVSPGVPLFQAIERGQQVRLALPSGRSG